MGRRPLFIYFFNFCNFPLEVFQNKNNKLSLSCLSASNSFLIFHGRVSWSLVDEFLSPQPSFLVTHGLLWKGKCLMTQEHLAHFPALVQNISWFIVSFDFTSFIIHQMIFSCGWRRFSLIPSLSLSQVWCWLAARSVSRPGSYVTIVPDEWSRHLCSKTTFQFLQKVCLGQLDWVTNPLNPSAVDN